MDLFIFCVKNDFIIVGMASPTLSGDSSNDDVTGVKSFYEYTTFLHHQTTEDSDGNSPESQTLNANETNSRSRKSSTGSCRNSRMSTSQTPSVKSSDLNGNSGEELTTPSGEIISRNATASIKSESLPSSQASEEMSPSKLNYDCFFSRYRLPSLDLRDIRT